MNGAVCCARCLANIARRRALARAGGKAHGMGQHRLDHGLGLRPRHQRGAVDGEIEAPELASAGEVRDRLARRPATDERGQPLRLHHNRIFHSIEEAEWEVFKLRWQQHTGETLED